MKVCIIFAGGLQKRWHEPTCKHLSIIGGQTVISRLYNQLKPHFDKMYVVAWRPEIKELFPPEEVLEPGSLEILHESLLSTVNLWDDRTAWVYGDAVLSNAAVRVITSFDGPVQFFGHYSEIFAISFDRSIHERWKTALKEAATWEDRAWGTYRAFWGMKMRGRENHDGGAREFTHIEDGSSDVDEPRCLINLAAAVRRWKE